MDRWRRRGSLGGAVALALGLALVATRRLGADPGLAGPDWAWHTVLTWLVLGAAVGALVWLFREDGWRLLLADLSIGSVGATLGGLASYRPGPLGGAGERYGLFGVLLAVLLGAVLLSALKSALLQASGQGLRRAPLSYARGLCAAVLLVPLIVVLGVALLVIGTGYNG